MADISTWSPTAADNDFAVPDGFPENMKRSDINNCMREYKAAIRRQVEDWQWFNFGDVPTRTGNTTFTVPGDQTAVYTVGRRAKFTDSSTLYGTIASAVFGSVTTVTVIMDSGNLSASLTAVSLGMIDLSNASTTGPLGSLQIDPSQLKYLTDGDPEIIDITAANTAVFLPLNSARRILTLKNSRSSGDIWLRQNNNTIIPIHKQNALAWKIPAGAGVTLFKPPSGDWRFVMQQPRTASILRSCNMIKFNGTSNYLYRPGGTGWFTGLSDGPTGMCSFWFKKTSSNEMLFESAGRVICQIEGDQIALDLSRIDLARSVRMKGSTSLVNGNIYHVLMQWDTNAAAGLKTLRMYINGTDDTPTKTDTFGAFDVGYSAQFGNGSISFVVGASASVPSGFFSGSLGDFYYAPNQGIDISVLGNRQKFRTAAGEPADMGSNGATPTGSAPLLFLQRAAIYAGYNDAPGSSSTNQLTAVGTFVDLEEGP